MTNVASQTLCAPVRTVPSKFYFAEHASSASRSRPEIVLTAPDLATAQRTRRKIVEQSSGVAPLVMLRVEGLLAETFAQAREILTDCRARTDSGAETVRYVGTADGLAGLIADIDAADVADGVVLVPLDAPGSTELIEHRTIPMLCERGMVFEEGVVQ